MAGDDASGASSPSLNGLETIPNGDPSAMASIAASWQRSASLGLRRHDRALFNHVATQIEIRRIADENRFLALHAEPELERLYCSLGSARWLALCVNGKGQVVSTVGNRASAPKTLQVLMHPGRLLTESELGTTAPGCTLAVQNAVVVTRDQHYLLELEDFFCASAPVHGADGTLAGVVDITGVDVKSIPLASDMIAMAGRRIENAMLLSLQAPYTMRFHYDERLLGTPFEGIFQLDRDGRVCGMNRAARQLFAWTGSEGLGCPLYSMFNGDLESLLRRAGGAGDVLIPVETVAATRGFLKIAETSTRSRRESRDGRSLRTSAAALPRLNRPLEDLELHAIGEMLRQCDGNVALAARKLGISRGTLYTRLKRSEDLQSLRGRGAAGEASTQNGSKR